MKTVIFLLLAAAFGAQAIPKTPAEQVDINRAAISIYSGTNVQEVLESIDAELASRRLSRQPYFSVKIDQNQQLTSPAQFTNTLAEFRMISAGSISAPRNDLRYSDRSNSVCYTMRVFSSSPVTNSLKMFAADDWVYLFINGSQTWAHTQLQTDPVFNSPNAPTNCTYTLPSGTNTIQIIRNDYFGGARFLELFGDIVNNTNVFFLGD